MKILSVPRATHTRAHLYTNQDLRRPTIVIAAATAAALRHAPITKLSGGSL